MYKCNQSESKKINQQPAIFNCVYLLKTQSNESVTDMFGGLWYDTGYYQLAMWIKRSSTVLVREMKSKYFRLTHTTAEDHFIHFTGQNCYARSTHTHTYTQCLFIKLRMMRFEKCVCIWIKPMVSSRLTLCSFKRLTPFSKSQNFWL